MLLLGSALFLLTNYPNCQSYVAPNRASFLKKDWAGLERPRINLDIGIIILSDSAGTRLNNVPVKDIEEVIHILRNAYSPHGIDFNIKTTVYRSTLLNSVVELGEQVKTSEHREELAKIRSRLSFSDRSLLVLYRWGRKEAPHGQGLGGFPYKEVLICGRSATNGGTSMIAHEIGHALGLGHTFTVPRSYQEASEHLIQNSGDVNCFDGDGLSDTLPDPGIQSEQTKIIDGIPVNLRGEIIAVNGLAIKVPKWNLMSYIGQRVLSPMQGQITRWHALNILRSNKDVSGKITEAESVVSGKQSTRFQIQEMSGFGNNWSGNSQVFSNQTGHKRLVFRIPVEPNRKFELSLLATCASDYGKIRYSVNDSISGEFDLYSPLVMPSGQLLLTDEVSSKNGLIEVVISSMPSDQSPGKSYIGIDGFVIKPIGDKN